MMPASRMTYDMIFTSQTSVSVSDFEKQLLIRYVNLVHSLTNCKCDESNLATQLTCGYNYNSMSARQCYAQFLYHYCPHALK